MDDQTGFETISPEELEQWRQAGLTGDLLTGDPMTRQVAPAEGEAPEEEMTWGDHGANVMSGVGTLIKGAGALMEFAGSEEVGPAIRDYGAEKEANWFNDMTPYGKRMLTNSFDPWAENSAWSDHPVDTLLAKGVNTIPSLAASIIPAFLVPRLAAVPVAIGLNATQSAGATADQAYNIVDGMTDEELMQVPRVRGYLESGIELPDAREMYREDAAGMWPIVSGIVTFLTGGVEGMVAGRIAGDAGRGFFRGIGHGAATEAMQEAPEGVTQELAKQDILTDREGKEWNFWDMLVSGVEGALVGGFVGGAVGGPANIGGRKKPAPALQPTIVEPGAPAPAEALAINEAAPPPPVEEPPLQTPPAASNQPAAPVEATEPVPMSPPVGAPAASPALSEPAGVPVTTEVTPENNAVEGTVPDTLPVIMGQFDELKAGARKAVLVSDATRKAIGKPIPIPKGVIGTRIQGEGMVYHPATVAPAFIKSVHAEGLLGKLLAMPDTTKNDVAEAEARGADVGVLTVRNEDGVPVRDAATSSETIEQDAAQLQETMLPGSTLETRPIEAALQERIDTAKKPNKLKRQIRSVAEFDAKLPAIKEEARARLTEAAEREAATRPADDGSREYPSIPAEIDDPWSEFNTRVDYERRRLEFDERSNRGEQSAVRYDIPDAGKANPSSRNEMLAFQRRVVKHSKPSKDHPEVHPFYEEARKVLDDYRKAPVETNKRRELPEYKVLQMLYQNEYRLGETHSKKAVADTRSPDMKKENDTREQERAAERQRVGKIVEEKRKVVRKVLEDADKNFSKRPVEEQEELVSLAMGKAVASEPSEEVEPEEDVDGVEDDEDAADFENWTPPKPEPKPVARRAATFSLPKPVDPPKVDAPSTAKANLAKRTAARRREQNKRDDDIVANVPEGWGGVEPEHNAGRYWTGMPFIENPEMPRFGTRQATVRQIGEFILSRPSNGPMGRRMLLKRMMEFVGDRPVYMYPTRQAMVDPIRDRLPPGVTNPDAYYRETADAVFYHMSEGDPDRVEHSFTHEVAHVATIQGLRDPGKRGQELRAHITTYMSIAKDYITHRFGNDHPFKYAFYSAEEFVAEAIGNARFQQVLIDIPFHPSIRYVSFKPRNIFSAFVDALRRYMGLGPNQQTMLESVLLIAEDAMTLQSESVPMARNVNHQGDIFAIVQNIAAPKIVKDTLRAHSEVKGVNAAKFLMRGMTLRNIHDQFNHLFEDRLTKIVEAIEAMNPFVRKIRDTGQEFARRFDELSDKDEFATLAIDAANLNVNLGPGADNSHLKAKSKRAIQSLAKLPALQERFGRMSPAARTLFNEMVGYYKSQQEKIAEKLIGNALDDILPEGISTADRDTIAGMWRNRDFKTMKDVSPLMNTETVKKLKAIDILRPQKGAYFPQMRFGNWAVVMKDKKPADTMGGNWVSDDTVEFVAASKREANKMAKAFEEAIPNLVISNRNTPSDSTQNDFRVRVKLQLNGLEFFESAAEAAAWRQEHAGEFEKVSEVMPRDEINLSGGDLTSSQFAALLKAAGGKNKSVQKAINNAAVLLMAGNRVQHRALPRNRVRGASKDFTRSTLAYAESSSHYLAKLEHSKQLNEGMIELRKFTRESTFATGAGLRRAVLNEMERRVNKNVVEATAPPAWLHNILAVSQLNHLASAAYSFVNAMQTGMVTFPILAGKFGVMDTTAAIGRAYRDIGAAGAILHGVKNTGVGFKQINKFDIDSTDVLGSVKRKLADDEFALKVIAKLEATGKIEQQVGFELAQSVTQNMGPTGRTIAKVDRAFRQLPIAVEIVNRAVSGIAAARLAMDNGMTEAQALAEAVRIVDSTQGDYSASNAAPVFNTTPGRFMLQFKKYAQLMLYLLGDMLHQSFAGATPQERWVARKQIGAFFTMQVLMAGTLGLPMLEFARLGLIVTSLMGLTDTYEEYEELYREWLMEALGKKGGEMVAKGIIPRLLNVDLSGRLGLDNMLTYGQPQDEDSESATVWAFKTLAGAPASMILDTLKYGDDFAKMATGQADANEVMKALENLPLLKVVADTIAATRKYQFGDISASSGKQLHKPISEGEWLLNVFGLRSGRQAEEAARTGYRFNARGDKDELERSVNKLKNQFAEAETEGERVKLLARMRELNRTLPEDMQLRPADLRKFRKGYLADKRKGRVMGGFRVNEEGAKLMRRGDDIFNAE